MPHPTLTTEDAADRLGTTTAHVRKLARERRIPHYRIGGLIKFDPDELEVWVAERHVGQRAVEAGT